MFYLGPVEGLVWDLCICEDVYAKLIISWFGDQWISRATKLWILPFLCLTKTRQTRLGWRAAWKHEQWRVVHQLCIRELKDTRLPWFQGQWDWCWLEGALTGPSQWQAVPRAGGYIVVSMACRHSQNYRLNESTMEKKAWENLFSRIGADDHWVHLCDRETEIQLKCYSSCVRTFWQTLQ